MIITQKEIIEQVCSKHNFDISLIEVKEKEYQNKTLDLTQNLDFLKVRNEILITFSKLEQIEKNQNKDFIFVLTMNKNDFVDIINSDMYQYNKIESNSSISLFVKRLSNYDKMFNLCRVRYTQVENFEQKYFTKEFKKRFKIRRMKRNDVLSYYLTIK